MSLPKFCPRCSSHLSLSIITDITYDLNKNNTNDRLRVSVTYFCLNCNRYSRLTPVISSDELSELVEKFRSKDRVINSPGGKETEQMKSTKKVKTVKKEAPDFLESCASIYRERNLVYGDNYKTTFGNVMMALFPDGLTIKTLEDWNRLGTFVQKISKLTRYASNYSKGGHTDSLEDDIVYTAMLRELDESA